MNFIYQIDMEKTRRNFYELSLKSHYHLKRSSDIFQ